MTRKLIEQMLEALNEAENAGVYLPLSIYDAQNAAKEYLAQPEQSEPRIDFTVLYQFAEQQGISYNKLCTAVHLAVDIAPQPKAPEPLTYTSGHCKEKAKPGGCQLHNLQCGYPKCDRKSVLETKQEQEMSKAEQLAAELDKPLALRRQIDEAAALLRQQDALLRKALEALEKVYMECEVHSDDGQAAMVKASSAIRELEEHLK